MKKFIVILFSISVTLLSASRNVSYAQQTGESWSSPVNLSNMPTNSAYPVIVADQSGTLHVFWTENLSDYGFGNNIIYYTRFDQSGWSDPVDIITSPQGPLETKADQPDVAIGMDGLLHLVFVGGWNGAVYYTTAYSDEATFVRSWNIPIMISRDITDVGNPNILVDPQGVLHVFFQSGQGKYQGQYHIESTDNGITWTAPAYIPGTSLDENQLIIDTRVSISSDDRIHLTWASVMEGGWPPRGIYYTYSTDGGQNWQEPISVVSGPYRYPDVLALGNDQVFLVWSGTSEERFKYSQVSDDGGLSWSTITKMSHIGGFQGYSGMAVDSLGRVHLGMAASCFPCIEGDNQINGDALIHSAWDGTAWTEPTVLVANRSTRNNLQYADIAITEGNIANIVVMYPIDNANDVDQLYQFDIFYVRGVLDVPHIKPLPTPTRSLATPTETPTETQIANFGATLQDTAVPTQSAASVEPPARSPSISPSFPLIVGAVPVGVLLVLYGILRKWIFMRR